MEHLEQLNKDYLTEFYTYLSQQNFQIYFVKDVAGGKDLFYVVSKDDTSSFSSIAIFSPDCLVDNAQAFTTICSSLNIDYSNFQGKVKTKYQKLSYSFFIDFYKQHPEYQHDIIKHYSNLHNQLIDYSFSDFLDKIILKKDNITFDKNIILKTINMFSVDDWTVTKVELHNLKKYLENKQFSTEEIQSFFLPFLKNRKKQIKVASTNINTRNFLLKLYNHDEQKLESYLKIVPSLVSHFNINIETDIFEASSSYTIEMKVNCKKMSHCFCIDYWDSDNYRASSFYVLEAIKDVFDLSSLTFEDDKRQGMFKVFVSHNNDNFNKQKLEKLFIDAFKFIKDNNNKDVSTENMILFFRKHHLEQSLNDSDNNKNKKAIKI